MSVVSEVATVRLWLADFAKADSVSKINMIGGGLTAIGTNPDSGMTAGFTLVVQIGVPPELYGAECAMEIVLEEAGGQLAEIAGPGPAIPPQLFREGQTVKFNEPQFGQLKTAPTRYLPARSQWVLGFPTGLPLAVGKGYVWRVKIDTEGNDGWVERFVVLGPPAGPVLG